MKRILQQSRADNRADGAAVMSNWRMGGWAGLSRWLGVGLLFMGLTARAGGPSGALIEPGTGPWPNWQGSGQVIGTAALPTSGDPYLYLARDTQVGYGTYVTTRAEGAPWFIADFDFFVFTRVPDYPLFFTYATYVRDGWDIYDSWVRVYFFPENIQGFCSVPGKGDIWFTRDVRPIVTDRTRRTPNHVRVSCTPSGLTISINGTNVVSDYDMTSAVNSNPPKPHYSFGFRSINYYANSAGNLCLGNTKIVTFDSDRISGRVTTPQGAPVPGVTVQFKGGSWATRTTDANGWYEFASCPFELNGTYIGASKSGATFSADVLAYAGMTNVNFTATDTVPPTVSAPPSLAVPQGVAWATPFTVDDNMGAAGVSITASSSDQAVLPNSALAVSGSGPQRTLTAKAPVRAVGQATVTLTATDLAGNAGTATFVVSTEPWNGSALRFGGASQAVATVSRDLTGTPFTIEAWLRRSSIGDYQIALSQSDSSGSRRVFDFGFYRGDFTLAFNGDHLWAGGSSTDNNWHHWAATYDTNRMERKIYRDGQLLASDRGRRIDTPFGYSPLKLGTAYDGKSVLDGTIDEVRVWNVARTAEEIQRSMNALVGEATGLLHYFRFNEGPGGTALVDAVSRASYNIVQPNPNATPFWVNGVPAKLQNQPPGVFATANALRFDGYDDVVTLADADSPLLRISGALTIEAWVYLERYVNRWKHIAGKPVFDKYGLILESNNQGEFNLNSGGTRYNILGGVLPTNQWTHIAGTYDPTDGMMRLYYNGRLASSKNIGAGKAIATSSDPFNVGGYPADHAGFPGMIDEVRVWNVVRSASQIQAAMQTAVPDNSPDLVACFRFNEGFGTETVEAKTGFASRGRFKCRVDFPGWVSGVPDSSAVNVAENSSATVALGGFDPEGANVTFVIDEAPACGTLTGTGGTWVYTPVAYFNGTDRFVYRVSDGTSLSAPAVVSLNVTPVASAPLAGSRSALRFDGSNYVKAPAVDLAGKSFTVEAWARHDRINSSDILLSQGAAAKNQGLHLGFLQSNVLRFGFWSNDLDTPVAYGDTNWHHWAATFDANTGDRRIYRDGVQVASDRTTDKYLGSGDVLIGQYLNTTQMFHGAIDEVRIWTTVRSPAEIARWQNQPLVGNEPELVAYYRFDEGAGLFASDSSASRKVARLVDGLTGPVWLTGAGLPEFNVMHVPENGVVSGNSVQVLLPGVSYDGAALTYEIVSAPQHGTFRAPSVSLSNVYLYSPANFFAGTDYVTYRVRQGSLVSSNFTIALEVQPVNQPPFVSSFLNQVVEEDETLEGLRFWAFDYDNAVDSLLFSARSSNPRLIPASNITFGGSGTNRTLTLSPVVGEIGEAVIAVDVSDGQETTTRTFLFEVRPSLVFQVVDAGMLPGKTSGFGTALNEQGDLAGFCATSPTGEGGRAFLYGGFGESALLTDLGTLGGATSYALGVNNFGHVVGMAALPNQQVNAFLRTGPGSSFNLGVLQGGTNSVAVTINDNLLIAGYSDVGGGHNSAFLAQVGVSNVVSYQTNVAISPLGQWVQVITATTNRVYLAPTLTNIGTGFAGATDTYAVAVNNSNQVVGFARMANGRINAFLYANGTFANLGLLDGCTNAAAMDINDQGVVTGYADATNGTTVAWVYRDGQMTSLGSLLGAPVIQPAGINTFGQIVGTATLAGGLKRPFLYEGATAYDLNALLPENSRWTIVDARAINAKGQIAATAITNNQLHAVVLYPATEIGRRLKRPRDAVPLMPDVELVEFQPGDTVTESFYWSEYEGKLFAVRPVTARIRWRVSNVLTNESRLETLNFNVWPKRPNVHVIGTAVQVEPNQTEFQYGFMRLAYTTINGADVDAATKVFTAPAPGWSVVQFLRNEGQRLNPQLQKTHFDVARSVYWNNTNYLRDRLPWVVGAPLADTNHYDWPGLNGYVFFEKAFYDGVGPDKAYDRSARRGPILPVNKDDPDGTNDLVVVWYAKNNIGVAWSSYPARYKLDWPTNAPEIAIASTKGTDALTQGTNLYYHRLDPTLYQQMRVYNQPDKALAGFNPNEEHAFMAPGENGQAVFALRHDLNDVFGLSKPFVLLKYMDANEDEWRMELFKVVATNAFFRFYYYGEAGKEIQPPIPLSVLPLTQYPSNYVSSGPYFQDYNNKVYAKAAGLYGQNTNVVIRYYYPLQPGFYYDFDQNGANDVADGTPLAWLAPRSGGNEGTPHAVTYEIHWPSDTHILQIGETLTTSRRGLPAVRDMARLQVVYDSLNPFGTNSGTNGVLGVARLFDALSPREVPLPAGFNFQSFASLKRETIGGKVFFPDLPYYLYVRLYHDPTSRKLGFRGYVDDSGVGNPLTLINVMSARERDRLKELINDARWNGTGALVEQLYDLTRNPNQVDLDPRDNRPDQALRLGLTTVSNQVVLESLGSLPKALTAGLAGVEPESPRPGNALQLTGRADSFLTTSDFGPLQDFTLSAWLKVNPTNTGFLFTNAQPGAPFACKLEPTRILIAHRSDSGVMDQVDYSFDTNWHCLSLVRNLADGELRVYVDAQVVSTLVCTSAAPALCLTSGSALRVGQGFSGQIDELRVWRVPLSATELSLLRRKMVLGAEAGLAADWRFDEAAGAVANSAVFTDCSLSAYRATASVAAASVTLVASTAPTAVPPRFIVLAENNDPALAGTPVGLHLIRVDDGPYPGELKVIESKNVFDERLSLRHNNDFGGDPDRIEFQWFYKPDSASFDPADLPDSQGDPQRDNWKGWLPFPVDATSGVNTITLGEGGRQSSILTLSDNWIVMRYRGYNINGQTNWSDWIGDPASTDRARAMLAEGWIKRVVNRINAFEQRTTDFADNQVNILVSMIAQAGQRYEGDVALNADGSNLNQLGLIEIYETVLRRAKNLSIDGVPAVNYDPANNALLLAASRIANQYLLLGNEAYADAADPTIGLTTDSAAYGSLASTIFAFQNQLDSPLEEELCLLRGRDDKSTGVGAAPVYNRLLWNFTKGDGEVAYAQVYNITDQNGDGTINEDDAKLLYPQGHGDAWGHYLTATKTYYALLQNTNYTWVPRAEYVLLAGMPVQVDYLDERKFAAAAAAKAKTGAEVVDLTYRLNYTADPEGQWQGYYDSDPNRAWGVAEWGVRAGVGAYFDWLTANAILPGVDPNPDHVSIQKIDRTTVTELSEIATQAASVQSQIDQADRGLNPLGLAEGVVPFDIDPALFDSVMGRQTHFEQIYDRAKKSMQNALVTFNQANEMTSALRRQQDSLTQFARGIEDQERDYKNRLIEVFGYPYSGDIGPAKAYPAGYDGPDLVHFMYVNVPDLTGQNLQPNSTFTAQFASLQNPYDSHLLRAFLGEEAVNRMITEYTNTHHYYFDELPGTNLVAGTISVEFPYSTTDYAWPAPAAWGRRRAPGRLQETLSQMLQCQLRLEEGIARHNNALSEVEAQADLLTTLYDVQRQQLNIRNETTDGTVGFLAGIATAKLASKGALYMRDSGYRTAEGLAEALPKVVGFANDATSVARGSILAGAAIAGSGWTTVAGVAEATAALLGKGMEAYRAAQQVKLELQDDRMEVQLRVKELERAFREELTLRLELIQLQEALAQSIQHYQGVLAEGQRLVEERLVFRQRTAAQTQQNRYRDMAFRVFRNDALQKYRAQFDLAARYVFLAASAYDYEVNLLGSDNRSGRRFFEDIIRQRSLGQMVNDSPVIGRLGLANSLARLRENFMVLKPQLGLNNPQTELDRFSLRHEWLRISPDTADATANANWRAALQKARMTNLWELPEFRRYCRPFAPASEGPQPGLVLRFPTEVVFRHNYFGWPLGPADSAYDPSQFATKVKSVGVWFSDYPVTGLSQTPRVYLAPVGMDILRSPDGDDFTTRNWQVIDQKLPVPFPISLESLRDPDWIPMNDTLGGSFAEIRRHSSFRAYHDLEAFVDSHFTTDSRLIGRSVWNTQWMLIIPGGSMLYDSDAGLDVFINSVSDILLYFQTYSYSGN